MPSGQKNNNNTHVLFWVCLKILLLVHKYMSNYLWGILSKVRLGYFQQGDWPGACSAGKEAPASFSCVPALAAFRGVCVLLMTVYRKQERRNTGLGVELYVVECLDCTKPRVQSPAPHKTKCIIHTACNPLNWRGTWGRQMLKDQKCKVPDYTVSSQ